MSRYEIRSDNNFRPYICDTYHLNDLPLRNGAISLQEAVRRLNKPNRPYSVQQQMDDMKEILDELGKQHKGEKP